MYFKDISYLGLWPPFCSVEQSHLCNFGKGHYEEPFCEFISNLGQWIRRCCLKDFLSEALEALLFSRVKPFMQFCKEGIMGNFHVKLNELWTSGSGGYVT